MSEQRMDLTDVPRHAIKFFEIGTKTGESIRALYARFAGLFASEEPKEFVEIAEALQGGGWPDDEAAIVVDALAIRLGNQEEIDTKTVARWIRQHPGQPDAVIHCLELVPPEGFEIIRLLSRKGSQKLVFLASSTLFQREVVIKKSRGISDLSREFIAHPLNLSHPHIVKTYRSHEQARRGSPY